MFTTTLHADYLALSFHAPESANALSLDGARALDRLRRAHRDLDRPVVVTSAHPTIFCAGGNLKDHAALKTRAAGRRANAEIARHLAAFQNWAVPKLAVVDGRALGGGVEWLARFDVRWATPRAELIFWQKHVGLAFGWGGGAAWSQFVGEARVRQLLLEGRALDAAEAHRLGLIDRLVAPGRLDEEIAAWAKQIASPINAELARWSVRNEKRTFARLWGAKAHRAALAAFGRR